MSKQVTIYLARRVTLNRADHEPVELQAGRNTVDADVAAHPFVKAHTVDGGSDNSGELDELRAALAEQSAHILAANAQLNARAKENDARVADLQEQLAQKDADAEALKEARNEALAQLAQKSADLDALVASMTPPAEAKPAKTKA